MSEDTILLNPEEIKKRREKKQSEEVVEHVVEKSNEKYFNKAGTVAIQYESMNRFDTPDILYFSDYSIEDVNDITLTRPEDIFENLICILNKLVKTDVPVKIENMTIDEFLETLVGIKLQFNTHKHIHRWICDCQSPLDEKDRQINEFEIDLRTIQYVSIEEADEKLREYYRKVFEIYSDEEWKEYLLAKYSNNPLSDINAYTREEEVKKIKITEPINLPLDGHVYSFVFTRIKHLIDGQKLAQKQYSGRIKQIQNKRETNVPLAELKQKKDDELNKLKDEQNKKSVLYARSLTLEKLDGKVLSNEERIQIFPKLSRNIMFELINFLDQIHFGINDEREMICSICGKSERGLLQQELNPIELLPLDSSSTGKHREHSRINIYFG